jgi:hypothetical protein
MASELNEIWRSVFERIRAADEQHDTGSANSRPRVAARRMRDAQGFEKHLDSEWSFPDRHGDAMHPQTSAAAAAAFASLTAVRNASVVPSLAVASDARSLVSRAERPLINVAIEPVHANDMSPAPLSMERAPAARTTPRLLASTEVADEIVSVFVQRGTVAITVRNAALTDDEALRCAFETARTLAGEPAALRELTLNGRTVYLHSPHQGSAAAPTLVFAC